MAISIRISFRKCPTYILHPANLSLELCPSKVDVQRVVQVVVKLPRLIFKLLLLGVEMREVVLNRAKLFVVGYQEVPMSANGAMTGAVEAYACQRP